MKTKTSLFLAAGFTGLSALSVNAQIAINKSFSNPNASAILDLNTGNAGVNKGFLAPQVALTNVATAAPVTSPATGLIVYSTTAPTGGNGTGYYFWNGTAWSGMDATINGSGTANYIARWTNATTLGTGLIQDNGTGVGVNSAPSGDMLHVYTTFRNAISGVSDDMSASGIYGAGYTGGYFTDPGFDVCSCANNGNGITGIGNNYGGKFQDMGIDYAYLADAAGANGITAYGGNNGGSFSDQSGDITYIADNATEQGINVYGITTGAYFHDANNDFAYIADGTYATGGYFEDAGGDYAYVAYSGYGILSAGTKSTMVRDENNKQRVLFCDESPEVLFHDYGNAQLSNGKVHIDLDPLWARTVAINQKHPLRVLITLNDINCNGVAVINRTGNGFDVAELNHGTSNASFTYEVIANRADTKNAKGETYNYSDWRYPVGPERLKESAKQAPVKPVFKAQSPNRGN